MNLKAFMKIGKKVLDLYMAGLQAFTPPPPILCKVSTIIIIFISKFRERLIRLLYKTFSSLTESLINVRHLLLLPIYIVLYRILEKGIYTTYNYMPCFTTKFIFSICKNKFIHHSCSR